MLLDLPSALQGAPPYRTTHIRRLSAAEIDQADALAETVRAQMLCITDGDQHLFFALRRRLLAQLRHGDFVVGFTRRKLQTVKYAEQGGCCAVCGEVAPRADATLDRFDRELGYTMENTRLVHVACKRA